MASGYRIGTIGFGTLRNPLGWAWQDYPSLIIPSATITRNDNGVMLEDFDPTKIVSGTAVIVRQDYPDEFAYSGTTKLFSSKITVTSHIVDAVTLNSTPNPIWDPIRIYYLYRFDVLPANYTIAPSFIRNTNVVEMDNLFVSEEEFAAFFPLDHNDPLEIKNAGFYTHGQIDAHINDTTTNPHNVTAEQVGSTAAFDKEDQFLVSVDNQTVFNLAETPASPETTSQMLVNGVAQIYGDHYTISGNVLTFNPSNAGFQLENVNEFGQPDRVIVRYMI